MELVVAKWGSACRLARQLGPYVVIEAVMPGGSLMVLALYFYRRRKTQSTPQEATWPAT